MAILLRYLNYIILYCRKFTTILNTIDFVLLSNNIETKSFINKRKIMKDQTKIIVGLLAGAAAVAAVGLLLNSDKGTEIKEEVSDYLADLINSVKAKVQSGTDNLAELKDNAFKAAKSAVKNNVNNVNEAISSN